MSSPGLSETWVRRRCGLERCLECRAWFQVEARFEVVCPGCQTSRPCFVCGRVHGAPRISCLEAKVRAEGARP